MSSAVCNNQSNHIIQQIGNCMFYVRGKDKQFRDHFDQSNSKRKFHLETLAPCGKREGVLLTCCKKDLCNKKPGFSYRDGMRNVSNILRCERALYSNCLCSCQNQFNASVTKNMNLFWYINLGGDC